MTTSCLRPLQYKKWKEGGKHPYFVLLSIPMLNVNSLHVLFLQSKTRKYEPHEPHRLHYTDTMMPITERFR